MERQRRQARPAGQRGAAMTPAVESAFIHLEPISPEDALEREWLCTNGLGGYAMGSIAGACTRRYHGLLVAALKPPPGAHRPVRQGGRDV